MIFSIWILDLTFQVFAMIFVMVNQLLHLDDNTFPISTLLTLKLLLSLLVSRVRFDKESCKLVIFSFTNSMSEQREQRIDSLTPSLKDGTGQAET